MDRTTPPPKQKKHPCRGGSRAPCFTVSLRRLLAEGLQDRIAPPHSPNQKGVPAPGVHRLIPSPATLLVLAESEPPESGGDKRRCRRGPHIMRSPVRNHEPRVA